jgi:proline racemase
VLLSSDPVRTVESHTEGMPTRVVLGGLPVIPGHGMPQRLAWARSHLDDLRKALVREPRGHAAMFGAILMPATRPDADVGVLYMSASGFLPMCGHGTIGVATVLVARALVAITEPTTEVRLDTPAGLVVARVSVYHGRPVHVTFTNVASFVAARDVPVEVPGYGTQMIDIAYGGNFYAIVEAEHLGVRLHTDDRERLTDLGLTVIRAVREQVAITHPARPGQAELRAAVLAEAAGPTQPARNLMVKEPRYFDRSPCGTGTSARMALLHARGQLAIGQEFVHESILGTRFQGRLTGITTVGALPAVIPEITGRAWITGTSEFSLDPSDPFPAGFEL